MAQNRFFKVGFCAQCNGQIMVTGTNGQLSHMRRNYKMADLEFDDGHRIRVGLCDNCLSNINYQEVIDALTHQNAQVSQTVKDQITQRIDPESLEIIDRGLPVKHREVILQHKIREVNSGY